MPASTTKPATQFALAAALDLTPPKNQNWQERHDAQDSHSRHFLLAFCAVGAGPSWASPHRADPVRPLVQRLDLEKYKATIKGLTRFGDRRQGTARNRAAIDWIEAQLKSYGCTNTERLTYQFGEEPPHQRRRPSRRQPQQRAAVQCRRGARRAASASPPASIPIPGASPMPACARWTPRPRCPGRARRSTAPRSAPPIPDEMYIVSAHMDGIGFGEAANDNGSGTALVMELARILSSPDVQTDRSIRFILWNNEETGLNGAAAYVAQRQALQGKEMPAGSGRYPEPKWLGMIQHDMMLFDHGMPRADGTVSPQPAPRGRRQYRIPGELEIRRPRPRTLAWALESANEQYATDYPAAIGSHMTNTDSHEFQDVVASVSLRENERGAQVGNGWDPQWHQPTDLYATYDDKDFRLGLNAAQTTLVRGGAAGGRGGEEMKNQRFRPFLETGSPS